MNNENKKESKTEFLEEEISLKLEYEDRNARYLKLKRDREWLQKSIFIAPPVLILMVVFAKDVDRLIGSLGVTIVGGVCMISLIFSSIMFFKGQLFKEGPDEKFFREISIETKKRLDKLREKK